MVIGKTHLPELAIIGDTESAAFGTTRNPWNTDRSPAGSSGGSAAAVAAGLVGAATASDGAGSIRLPAANCGLFGLKPTRGLISLAPLTDHWYGMSVLGFHARGVADAALLLDVAAERQPSRAVRGGGGRAAGAAAHRDVGQAARAQPTGRRGPGRLRGDGSHAALARATRWSSATRPSATSPPTSSRATSGGIAQEARRGRAPGPACSPHQGLRAYGSALPRRADRPRAGRRRRDTWRASRPSSRSSTSC